MIYLLVLLDYLNEVQKVISTVQKNVESCSNGFRALLAEPH